MPRTSLVPLTTALNHLAVNKRHLNLSIMIVGHKLTDYDPKLRCNASLIFVFKPKNMKETEIIRNEFLGCNANEMSDLIDYVYKGRYDFMIIDQTLRKGGEYIVFRNFNKLNIIKDNANIYNAEKTTEESESK